MESSINQRLSHLRQLEALADGERLLIVEADPARRSALSSALWQARPEQFLANGLAGPVQPERRTGR